MYRGPAYKRRIENLAKSAEAAYLADPKRFDRYGYPPTVVDFSTRQVWLNSVSAAQHLITETPLGDIPFVRFEDYVTPSGITSAQREVIARLGFHHPAFVRVMASRLRATPVLVTLY